MIHAKVDNTAVNPYEVGALLASAYPERIGKKWKEGVGVFQLSGGELVAVEPSDALAGAEWRRCTGKWGAWEKSSWRV